jgi:uncharacterized lipoprotein YajG
MAKYLVLLCAVVMLAACRSDPNKYELKSPCVSADSDSHVGPCQKRMPANQWIS